MDVPTSCNEWQLYGSGREPLNDFHGRVSVASPLGIRAARRVAVAWKGEVLKSGKFDKVAIANPAAAPYGAAAVEAMRAMGVYEALTPRIVEGNNISQAHQFVATGAAEIGFVAGSQVALTAEGSRWIVPENLYSPIYQDAVLLKKGAQNPAATAFLDYLRGPEAAKVLAKYGYGIRK